MSFPIPSWVNILVANARQRALTRGLHFDLTPQDVLEMWEEQDGKCYWFGVPMQWRDDAGPRHPLIPSLDRTDNNRGYIRPNVVLVCWAANTAKGACDLESWEEFLDFLRAAMRA